MKDDKERLKAAARMKKEKAKGKENSLSSKRKEPDSAQPKKTKQTKKSRVEVDPAEIEPIKKRSSPGSVVVGLPADRGKGSTPEIDPSGNLIAEPVKMKGFLEAVSKAFLKSSYEESSPPDSNRAKLQLSFNRSITVSFFFFIYTRPLFQIF